MIALSQPGCACSRHFAVRKEQQRCFVSSCKLTQQRNEESRQAEKSQEQVLMNEDNAEVKTDFRLMLKVLNITWLAIANCYNSHGR